MKDIGKQTKASIIQAIDELAAQKPLNKISMREICQKANIALGTFYIYFKSKEEAMLYVYHQLDESFLNLSLDEFPLKNLERILRIYYNLVKGNELTVHRQLYICHLSHYDDYYFSEHRPLFTVLFHEIYTLVKNKEASRKITWFLLDFCRGRFFNLLIKSKYEKQLDKWVDEQVPLTLDYLIFLIEKEGILIDGNITTK